MSAADDVAVDAEVITWTMESCDLAADGLDGLLNFLAAYHRFHLSGTHPPAIDTAAQWQAGDPLTDIDGDQRPAIDGTPDYAGADLPQ